MCYGKYLSATDSMIEYIEKQWAYYKPQKYCMRKDFIEGTFFLATFGIFF
jgi:hypothetical protein